MTPIYRVDGSRYLDWLKLLHHEFLDYDNHDHTKEMYISGGYIIIKTQFLRKHRFNEALYWGQAEDVEWSTRINHEWTYRCNTLSSARLLKDGK
jgi:hypothetical protein